MLQLSARAMGAKTAMAAAEMRVNFMVKMVGLLIGFEWW